MPALRLLGIWVLLSLAVHLIWELAQLPLYTLWRDETPPAIAWAVIHCTAGDGLIALGSFLVAWAWAHDVFWPWHRLARGLPVLIASGVGYTAFSEWYNVHVLGSWAYSEHMPTIFGIGVSPLLQWIVVPLAVIWLMRRLTTPPSLPWR